MKKIVVLISLLFLVLSCVGCSTDMYDDVGMDLIEEVEKGQSELLKGDGSGKIDIPRLYYEFGLRVLNWVPLIITCSLMLGVWVFFTFDKVVEIRKWALKFLIILIPVTTWIGTLFYCYLYGIFNT